MPPDPSNHAPAVSWGARPRSLIVYLLGVIAPPGGPVAIALNVIRFRVSACLLAPARGWPYAEREACRADADRVIDHYIKAEVVDQLTGQVVHRVQAHPVG